MCTDEPGRLQVPDLECTGLTARADGLLGVAEAHGLNGTGVAGEAHDAVGLPHRPQVHLGVKKKQQVRNRVLRKLNDMTKNVKIPLGS